MRHLRTSSIITLLLASLSSVAFAQTADVQARMQAAAKAVPKNFQFFYVPSSGVIADETFVVTYMAKGLSAIAIHSKVWFFTEISGLTSVLI